MGKLRRYDTGELKSPTAMPNGWLRADAFVTRAGVFVYRNPDGSERRELRHPDDVFAAESLATLAMAPVTDGHPATMLDASNARSLSVGHLGERIDRDETLVRAAILLVDAPAIDAVRSGARRELSCGYDADVIEEAGVFDGEPYTHRQRAIEYNHVAIVPAGRAGPLVRMRIDGEERLVAPTDGAVQVRAARVDSKPGVQITPSAATPAKGDKAMGMTKVRRDSVTIELEEGQAQALEMLLAQLEAKASTEAKERETLDAKLKDALSKLKDVEGQVVVAEGEAEKAKAEADGEKARADSLDAKLKDVTDPAKMAARISERVALVGQASPVLGSEVKLDSLTDIEIRKAVAEKLTGTKLDGKSEAYIEARFDAEIARVDAGAAALGKVRTAAQHADATDPLTKADNAFREASQKAWQTPL